jgi:F-type H+-transporting ATPase subunit delta
MAELVTVARPYAKAAFSVANTGANKQQADKKLAQWSGVLQVLANTISCPEGKTIIDNPDLPRAKTEEILNELCEKYCGKTITKDIKNFIHILVENGRLALAPEIYNMFEEFKADREEIKDAVITTAFPIEDDNQLKALTAQLEQRFSCKIKPTVKVDTNLIGGVIIEIGDEVVDASIRGKLEKMAVVLKS